MDLLLGKSRGSPIPDLMTPQHGLVVHLSDHILLSDLFRELDHFGDPSLFSFELFHSDCPPRLNRLFASKEMTRFDDVE